MFSTTDRKASGGSETAATVEWGTPQELFDGLNARWGPFTLDAAASDHNHKCERYFTVGDDALEQPWGDGGVKAWLNPPFGMGCGVWFSKIAVEIAKGNIDEATVLVPARVDTQWFHRHVIPHASSIHFIEGRLSYTKSDEQGNVLTVDPAPFPSMVVRMTGPRQGDIVLKPMLRDGSDADDKREWL